MSVEKDINKRWEKGVDHHPKSIAIFEALEESDLKYGGDNFCWKSGGDGDNGETLMFALDVHFELEDEKNGATEDDKTRIKKLEKEVLRLKEELKKSNRGAQINSLINQRLTTKNRVLTDAKKLLKESATLHDSKLATVDECIEMVIKINKFLDDNK